MNVSRETMDEQIDRCHRMAVLFNELFENIFVIEQGPRRYELGEDAHEIISTICDMKDKKAL